MDDFPTHCVNCRLRMEAMRERVSYGLVTRPCENKKEIYMYIYIYMNIYIYIYIYICISPFKISANGWDWVGKQFEFDLVSVSVFGDEEIKIMHNLCVSGGFPYVGCVCVCFSLGPTVAGWGCGRGVGPWVGAIR